MSKFYNRSKMYRARKMYLESLGKKKLSTIAKIFNVPVETVKTWKRRYLWDKKLSEHICKKKIELEEALKNIEKRK